MKKCQQCGQLIHEDDKFCVYCGYPNQHNQEIDKNINCPVCGAHLEEDMKFCIICGTKIEKQSEDDKQKEIKLITCYQCGAKFNHDVVFCTNCGAKIEEDHIEEKNEIEQIENQLEEQSGVEEFKDETQQQIKKKIICPNCKEEFDREMAFCTKCGTKIDENEEKVNQQNNSIDFEKSVQTIIEKIQGESQLHEQPIIEQKSDQIQPKKKKYICPNCKEEFDQEVIFCTKCGTKIGEETKKEIYICPNCSAKFDKKVTFCTDCGSRLDGKETKQIQKNSNDNIQTYLKKGLDNFTTTINHMAGEEGEVEIKFKELFSKVFEKHSIEEREEVFICGTKKTTPKEADMITEWPKPWLYSRVFIMFLIVFVLLVFMIQNFYNMNAVPGAIFIGSLMVPFSLLIFFWEVNVPRNISIFDVISMFFIGGALSLVCTLFLYEIVGGVEQLNYVGAILVGIIEEVGKITIASFYIKRKNTKYILNGMLIGACVGAGFAVFETAGYVFSAYAATGQINVLLDVLWLRSILSFGCHIAWSAIAGVGLSIAKKDKLLTSQQILDVQFLKFLFYAIVLHAIWDMPITLGADIHLVQWTLTAIAVMTVLVLLNAGLKQVSQYVQLAKKKEES